MPKLRDALFLIDVWACIAFLLSGEGNLLNDNLVNFQ